MASSQLSTQLRNRIASNNHETEKGVSSTPRAFAKDIKQNLDGARDDFFSQLLGIGKYEKSYHEGSSHSEGSKPYQKFTLYDSDRSVSHADRALAAPKIERRPHVETPMDYHAEIARAGERAVKRESRETQQQIQDIMAELQRLISSSTKIVQMEFGTYQVASAPKAIGKYQTNFLSWMLSVVRSARQQVEDAGAWLAVAKGKGKKRGYTQSAKSLGTSFTQSNERQVATQTG